MPKGGAWAVLALLLRGHRGLTAALLVVCTGYAIIEAGLVASVYPMSLGILGQAPRFEEGSVAARMWTLMQSISKTTPASAGLLLFALASVASFAVTYAKDVLRNYVSLIVRRDCQLAIFRNWITADYATVTDHKQGEIVFKVCGAPGGIGAAFIHLPELAAQAMTIVAVALVMCLVSVPTALALLGLGAGFHLCNRWLTYRYSYQVGEAKARCLQEQHVLVNESLNGIRELRVYGAMRWWIAQYERVTDGFRRVSRNVLLVRATPRHVLMVLAILAGGGAVLLSGQASGAALAVVPLVATGFFAAYRLMPVVAESGQMIAQVRESLPNVKIVLSELEAPRRTMPEGTTVICGAVEAVALERVSVRYHGRAEAIRHVSLTLTQGVTAIVGRSGSGKSTLVNVIVRLLDPAEGRVLVKTRSECVDLRETQVASWRMRIGFVGQEPLLLYGSVAENIAFGRSISREAIQRAAELAHASEFIHRLPEGLDTPVGEKGQELSGGQRQRIAIARALAGEPEVLIFDEATSSLDYETEAFIQQTILELSRSRVVVVVAHRLSSVRFAPQIAVLDSGRVVEWGAHQDLLAREGHYAELFRLQEAERWARV